MAVSPRITPCLWFDRNAEEAANFYVSIFNNSKITAISHYGEGSRGGAPGSVMVVGFELDGQAFTGLNGGPLFKFTEAISMIVNCETQAEVDDYWDKLTSDGGREVQCGWLKDKFGVSWQIVPTVLPELMQSNDPAKSKAVMAALMQMVKLDIAALKRAFENA